MHGLTNIAVVERGAIGQGSVGRNTTIVRSNYMLPGNARFYELGMKLWEEMSRELNYNVMFSQRGVLNLAHTSGQLDAFARRGNAMRLEGIDAELKTTAEIARLVPGLDVSPAARFPIAGGLFQPRAGHGAARRSGLGLRPRRGPPGRRHHRVRGGDGLPARGGARGRRLHRARRHPQRPRSASRSPATPRR